MSSHKVRKKLPKTCNKAVGKPSVYAGVTMVYLCVRPPKHTGKCTAFIALLQHDKLKVEQRKIAKSKLRLVKDDEADQYDSKGRYKLRS